MNNFFALWFRKRRDEITWKIDYYFCGNHLFLWTLLILRRRSAKIPCTFSQRNASFNIHLPNFLKTNSNIEEKILEIFGNFDFLCKLQQTGGYPEVRSNSILNRHGFNQSIFAFIIVSPTIQFKLLCKDEIKIFQMSKSYITSYARK